MKAERYQFADCSAGLLATLQQAFVEDKRAERNSFAGCVIFAVFILLAVVGLAMGSPTFSLVCLAVFLVAGWYWRHSKSHDLEDRRYQVPTRFLGVASADIPPSSQVKLDVDFRRYRDGGTQSSPGVYEHAWMALQARLCDGNSLRLDVVSCVKRKEKRKHRGTRVKERIRESLILRLALNPQRYPPATAVADALAQLPPPDLLQLVRARPLPDGSLEVRLARPPELRINGSGSNVGEVTGETLLAALVWTYRGVKGVKAASLPVASELGA